MANKGHSREQFFGTGYNHYDSKGHKTGESRRNWTGGFTEYDAKGKKIGESRPNWAGGYTHYDNKGHKTGESKWSMTGYNHYDSKGHKMGESNRDGFGGFSNNDNTTEGCYIATCIYGSYECPEVLTLRQFRDQVMKQTLAGRVFVKCYYAVSPTLVKWFGNSRWFHRFWKCKLDRMVDRLNKTNQ